MKKSENVRQQSAKCDLLGHTLTYLSFHDSHQGSALDPAA